MTTGNDTPRLVLRPPLYPLIALLIAIALEWVWPLHFLGEPVFPGWQSALGLGVLVGGYILAAAAIRRFRAAGTPADPHKPALILVSDGPNTFSRNLMYIGLLLIYLGLCVASALEWGLIFLPFMWLALDRLAVAREEAFLRGRFGAEYQAHLQRHRSRWF